MTNLENIRVRFAPSPTGYLHIGGLRTALFNYLFARHYNGKFILRIEDTDQTRKVEGAVENLINTMKLMGLDYDEGPETAGDYGPYFQSQRLDIYQKCTNDLLNSGHAYYCFCTRERLDEIRSAQLKQGLTTQYDRFCRNLSPEEISDKLKQNIPHVIRLKVPLNSEIQFSDLIRGEVKIETNIIDDQVLVKSDGYPTYHLANVIDDHYMKISHVIRGEEWLTSVPKHILLYKAFGWELPQFAHVPLIHNPDRSKLSKRQGDVATEDFLKKGYLKEALLNFIALLGWNPGEGETKEFYTKEELVSDFTIERVSASAAIFNIEKLDWMNSEYIKTFDLDELTNLSLPFFKEAGYDTSDFEKLKRVITALRTYIKKLNEIQEYARIYFLDEIKLNDGQIEFLKSETSQTVLKSLYESIEKLNEITPHNFKPMLNNLQKETGIKGKGLFQPIRFAVTGEEHGPDLGLIAFVLGKNDFLKKLDRFIIHT
jgi:nondiscriminating glutamyl-tRNA synthetase